MTSKSAGTVKVLSYDSNELIIVVTSITPETAIGLWALSRLPRQRDRSDVAHLAFSTRNQNMAGGFFPGLSCGRPGGTAGSC